ncbi:MAG: hypothetical protein HYY06_12815 [Deltaproteobacteria bacterium]|nr:hypothetical protein [Deltaproteobacteria bacterium]
MRSAGTKKASEPSKASLEEIPEVDFSRARVRRSPYARKIGARGRRQMIARFERESNVRLLDDDLAELFPDSRSVNDALRTLRDLAKRVGRPPRRRAA